MKNILIGALLGAGIVAAFGAAYTRSIEQGHDRFQIGTLRNGIEHDSYLLDTDTGFTWQLVTDTTTNQDSWQDLTTEIFKFPPQAEENWDIDTLRDVWKKVPKMEGYIIKQED